MTPRLFDRLALRRNRERAARGDAPGFLFESVADDLATRLGEVTGRRFATALVVGRRFGHLERALGGGFGIERLVSLDITAASGAGLVAEPDALPLAPGSLDLVASALALHAVDDLPGALLQLRRALRPDGLFLAALFGGETLVELRRALLDAELEVAGGAGPRVFPFADLRDAGALLQRAGFALPVADADRILVTYSHPFALMRDLRLMGEANALLERRRSFTRRETLMRAAALYAERHAGPDGRVTATFEVLYLTGWAPDAAQPKPLRPGSAAARLADALKGPRG